MIIGNAGFGTASMAGVTTCACALLLWASPTSAWAQSPPAGPGAAADCTRSGCHSDLAARPVVHSPVGSNECDSCHTSTSKTQHKFNLVADKKELCYECHDEEEYEGKSTHAPVSDGDCTACHDPHSSKADKLLTQDSVGDLCAECHEELIEDLEFLHGPVASGACTSCHNPHASDHASLLPAATHQLCLKCHEDIKALLAGKSNIHSPFKDACQECHDPHGGAERMSLKSAAPGLCFECHEDIEEGLESAPVKHAAVGRDRGCLDCHQPHASEFEHSLRQSPGALCMSCHNQELGSGEQKTVNMSELLEQHPNHHNPVKDDCSACHTAHSSEYANLLAAGYPAGLYTGFDEDQYALCFECHDAESFLDERTDEATAFRNGDQNLHFLHVNRKKKGRTCRACHDPHATKSAKLIVESVPFGSWRIPIEYTATENGGTCLTGCHRQYSYDREKAVSNIPSP